MGFLLNIVRNTELRIYARKQGCTRAQARQLVEGCKEEHLEQASKLSGVEIPPDLLNPPVGGDIVGDGFLKRIMDWLKSPQGQEFIKALFTLLIAILPLFI
jgi:hypothetical protein